MSQLFPHLFDPITLGPVTIRNRIVSSGHDTVLDDHGHIGDDLVAYHEARAKGGAGLIVLQVSGVHETARYTNHVLMATEESSSPGYTAVAEAVHRHGATIFAQLFHPGREVMDGERGMAPRAVAPSDEPQERFKVVPEALSTAAIKDIIAGYGAAAKRIADSGIDGVEIVASHGYLPIQFFNTRVNTRTDDYGATPARHRRRRERRHPRLPARPVLPAPRQRPHRRVRRDTCERSSVPRRGRRMRPRVRRPRCRRGLEDLGGGEDRGRPRRHGGPRSHRSP